MAGANFTKLIEFKVKGTELTRAVDKIFKGINKIEVKVKETNKGLKIVVKNFNDVEKELKKVNRETINWGRNLQKAAKDSTKLSNGILGLLKKVGVGTGKGGVFGFSKLTGELGLFDAGLRKISHKGLPYFTKRILEAGQAVGAFGLAHAGAIAAISTGAIVLGKGTRFFFDLGKAARQAEASVQDFIATTKKLGLKGGIGSLFPAGSHLGGLKGKQEAPSSGPSSPIGQYSSRGLEQVKARAIQSQYAGLTKINRELNRNRAIQENINAFSLGHARATREIAKSQVFYNVELAKTRAVQALVTADIFAAQRAWNGLVGIVKGATGILGGLLGGKAGKLGQAAGIIGVSAAIKDLVQKIPFVSQAWKDSIQAHALWVQRITEGITAVSIAYGGLNTALSAAQWVSGAISGFVKWEKSAAESIWRVSKQVTDFAALMQAAMKFKFNPFGKGGAADIALALQGGADRVEEKRYSAQGPTRQQGINAELKKQIKLLNNRNTDASDYARIQQKIFELEVRQTEAVLERKRARVEAGGLPADVFKDEFKARNDALDAYQDKFESHQQQLIKSETQKIKTQTNLRIQELDKANQIEMQGKQRIWDAEGKEFDIKLRRAVRLKKIAKEEAAERKKAVAARRERRGRLGESLMLGAGFPLLFGGGAGAVGGGVLGAGLQAMSGSKGFGAQIFLSAIGTAIDQFVGKTAEVGKALNDATRDLGALQTAMALNGTAMGAYLELLRKSKGEHAALKEAMKVLESQVGEAGAKALKEFGNDAKRLADNWAIAMLKVQAALARFINWTGLIGGKAKDQTDRALLARANTSTDPRMLELQAQGASARATLENFSGSRMSTSLQSATGRAKARLAELDAEKIKLQKIIELEKAKGAIYNDLTKDLAYQIKLKKATSSEEVRQIENARQVDQMMQIYVDKVTKAGGKLEENSEEWNKIKKAIEEIVEGSNKLDRIGDAMKQWKDRLDELKDPAYQLVSAADAIGNAFSDAFKGIVSGSMTAGEAFAAFTRSVANHFLDMAAEIAATALKHGIMKMLISAGFSAFGSTLGNTSNTFAGVDNATLDSVIGPSGTYNYSPKLAEGGYVSGPTNALIGEGGEGEYVIPESKMDDALAKYAGGARGDDVLAGGGEVGGEGGAGGASSGVIDVTFNSHVINDVSYVTYSDFQAGLQQAAAEGAKLGEKSTLRKLQTSPSTRRRVGV